MTVCAWCQWTAVPFRVLLEHKGERKVSNDLGSSGKLLENFIISKQTCGTLLLTRKKEGKL